MGSVFLAHGGSQLRAVCNGHGWEAPNSTGIFGGYPGTQNDRVVVVGSDVEARMVEGDVPTEVAGIAGERPEMHGRQGLIPLSDGDVIASVHQSGGGWGDPLARPVEDLAEDLASLAVSPEAAARLYGAVVVEGRIDAEATAARREELRAARREWPAAADRPALELPDGSLRRGPMGSELVVVEAPDGRAYVSCRCGHPLTPVGEPWREAAREHRSSDVHAFSRSTRLNPVLELREYTCPSCGTLLSTDVARVGTGILHDIELEG